MKRLFRIAALGIAASLVTVFGDQILPMDVFSVGVSFSKDGKFLAVLGEDRKIRVWDLAAGKLSLTLEPQPDAAFSSFLTSGNQFATVATNGAGQIRDTESGRVLTTFELPLCIFTRAMASTADGAMIAASSGDAAVPSGNRVQVFDRSGKPRFRLPAGIGGVSSMAFSPDGETLVSAAFDTEIRVWDVRTGVLQRVIDDMTVATFDLACSPDGKYLATAGVERVIYLRDTQSWKVVRKITGQPEIIWPIRFSPDGTMLVTGGFNGRNSSVPVKVILWAFPSGRQIHAWTAEHAVSGLAVSPDGKRVAVADGTKGVKLFAVPNARGTPRRPSKMP
jgi:hypothetical protein